MPINHDRSGSGKPLLLIHGIGHRWQAWQPVLADLARHHEVVAIDLPGFGASAVPADGMPRDMAAAVDGVRAAMAELGVQRPHVAGNSLGGAIALELAAAGAAASVTALSPAGFFTPSEGRRAVRILSVLRWTTRQSEAGLRRSLARPRLRDLTFGTLVADPSRLDLDRLVADSVALRDCAGFHAVARAARRYEFRATPDVPVTIGWGARDRILRPNQATRARQRLPAARHVELPGCGHVPMSDNPQLVSRLILETTGALSTVD